VGKSAVNEVSSTMTEIVTAVYENGILRPLRPLKLRDRQRVRVQVLPEEPADEVEEVIQGLISAGLMQVRPKGELIPPDPLSAEQRQALADRLGRIPGKSASEMVIEDRGER
jgi:predicted DNA-binding antitoxin AbrB/MazE fold protein